MSDQPSLFTDERKKCAVCQGTGKRFNHDLGWRDERPCNSCGGSGLERDRYNPDTARIPYGEDNA